MAIRTPKKKWDGVLSGARLVRALWDCPCGVGEWTVMPDGGTLTNHASYPPPSAECHHCGRMFSKSKAYDR